MSSNNNAIRIKRYLSSGGLIILAGQSDFSNDHLTFRVAKQNDLWFHVHGFPGSHVVLQCGDTEPDRKDIEEAAGVAVHYSKMRNASSAQVVYCHARDVHKECGAKAGSVSISHEKQIKASAHLPPEDNG
ncbi:MAG: DUF814 domain-containing protein [Spirochaetes bacterium]|nr:DUF814 domain-containing protein [Spirochaetota bacterium]